jgi:hypothetical protein
VDERRCDDLFLQVQSGAKLDLAADAERVDALIAGRRGCSRTEDLPPIRFRTSTGRATGLPALSKADELESPVAVEIGNGLHAKTYRVV